MRNIVSPLDGIRSPFGSSVSALSIYAVAGFEPPVVADFEAEYYRTGGSPTTFDSMFTHSASTNATMVDSDGLLKWRPHNLVTNSTGHATGWTNQNLQSTPGGSTTAPDGTTITANLIIPSTSSSSSHRTIANSAASITTTGGHKAVFYAKAAGYTKVGFDNGARGSWASFLLSGSGSVISSSSYTASITQLSSPYTDWYRCEAYSADDSIRFDIYPLDDSYTNVRPSTYSYSGDGTSGVYIWGSHVVRNNLGGMVNNPDQSTGFETYVPTTSSAVYLPRRGHHIYNGTSWVNEGLLIESEARTNLLTYSEQFDNGVWFGASSSTQANVETAPDGSLTADRYTFPAGAWYKQQNHETVFGVSYTISVWLKAVSGTQTIRLYGSNNDVGPDITLTESWQKFSHTFTATTTSSLTGAGVTRDTSGSAADFYLWGAQVEEGSTPSSYIPTSSATVTRAAETLTIPSAQLPWPSPVVIGSELVAGGEFNDAGDLAEWTLAGGTAAVDASGVTLTNTSTRTTLSETLSVATGKVYRLTGTLNNLTSGPNAAQIRITSTNNYSGTLVVGFASAASGDVGFEIFFVAPASTLYIWAANNTTTAGNLVRFDNISVKEIDPLAVSIQMDGTMTYADEGGTEVIFFDWRLNSGNYIQANLRTQSTATGEVYQLQAANSIADDVDGRSSQYTPGIDVPFNIASRHGSTFINGAVDGTALTADTTPVALPDLSASDLQLGYDYMGTIGQFRQWAKDLGDAGIEEASTNA